MTRSKNSRWTDDLLAQVREAWLGTESAPTIAARLGNGLTDHGIRKMASRQGWPKRERGRRRRENSVRSMPGPTLYLYQKLRAVLPREEALAGALAGWRHEKHEGRAS